MRETTADYLSKRITASAGWDACWPWLLSTNSSGYGNAARDGRVLSAHRLVWIHLFGDPGVLTVDHLCHNRICCNPMHT